MTRRERSSRLRGIYAIVNAGAKAAQVARAALAGGVRILQYRAKGSIIAEDVHALQRLAHDRGALLILNDDWRAAAALDCDGVHLGPDDIAFDEIEAVRALLGERIIGISCGTVQEVGRIDTARVDYLGVGAVFATASKVDAGEPIGIAGLTSVAAATTLPIAAIGGINRHNIAAVRASRVAMAAVISAIADAPDSSAAARELVNLWQA